MKKSLLFLLIFCLSNLAALAANPNKQYKKYVEKLDVTEEVKMVPANSPSLFWSTLLKTNLPLNQFLKDIKKQKGAEKEAISKTASLPKFYPQYDESVATSMQGFCDTLLMDMGISELGLNCSLHIVYADEINAFTVLTEKGFSMCITSGLLTKKGLTYEMLQGYVAHEFVHGALFHHIRSFYAEAKQRRKNEIIGGIEKGLNAVSAGVQTYTSAMYGVEPNNTDLEAVFNKIDYNVKVSTLKYCFKFSQEQEIECDLIAYRFLENLGYGEEYINSLRALGSDYDYLYDEYSDHPTTTSRIEFLQFVKEHPELGNKGAQ